MPRDTAREQEHYTRVRWLISLMYLMGLRISEVVSNPMGGFFRRRDRDGQDRWWLAITGKGDNYDDLGNMRSSAPRRLVCPSAMGYA
jgi:hypothetical protein